MLDKAIILEFLYWIGLCNPYAKQSEKGDFNQGLGPFMI